MRDESLSSKYVSNPWSAAVQRKHHGRRPQSFRQEPAQSATDNIGRLPEIDKRCSSSVCRHARILSIYLEFGFILDQRPRLFRNDDAALFMFFDRKHQALILPDDRGVELIPVSPGRHRCAAIGAVTLHSVPRRPGTSENGSFHNQVGTVMIDVSDDIVCPFWHASFVALLPCSRERWFLWGANSSKGKRKRREQTQKQSSSHILQLLCRPAFLGRALIKTPAATRTGSRAAFPSPPG